MTTIVKLFEPPPVIPFGLLSLQHPPNILDFLASNVAGEKISLALLCIKNFFAISIPCLGVPSQNKPCLLTLSDFPANSLSFHLGFVYAHAVSAAIPVRF